MSLSENISLALSLVPIELMNTIYMVLGASFFAFLIGLPIGIILTLTDRGGLKQNPFVYKILGSIVNIGRSVPFAILMIALIPFTRAVVGTSIGTVAAIVPLSIAAAPFFARLVESHLKKVDHELVEAALVMGANTKQIVSKIWLPETLPSLIAAMATTIVNLIGYSAMAGLVGAGGLGKIAIQYGYQRFNGFLMLVTLILLLLLVEVTQFIGNRLMAHVIHKRGRG